MNNILIAIIAGLSGEKPKLFVTDVTGNYFGYKANAIGENDEKIREMLREDYKEGINIEEGIKLGLKIFKKILGKNFDLGRFDVGYVSVSEKKLKRLKEEDLKKYIK